MARYAIWNKTDDVITPSGEIFTPEQWIARYPMAGLSTIKFVIAGGVINGAFAGEFTDMKDAYRKMGCAFTDDMTDEEVLAAIEAFEDEMNSSSSKEVSASERIAAALEYQVMASLPDEE